LRQRDHQRDNQQKGDPVDDHAASRMISG
jgi:hypothetical protein